MITQKTTIKLVFYSLFCNAQKSAKLNKVTKLKTKKITVSESMFSWNNKCEHSSILPPVHYEEKKY